MSDARIVEVAFHYRANDDNQARAFEQRALGAGLHWDTFELRGLAGSGVEGFVLATSSTALTGQSWSNGSRLNPGLKILQSMERPSNGGWS